MVGTWEETFSFKADLKESCRVPKTAVNHGESPLSLGVTNWAETRKECHKLTLVKTMQYHREFIC